MTTQYGPWEGTGSGQARIKNVYTRSYNSDHTEARYVGSLYIEFDTSISDSTNTWEVNSPDFADDSGTNLSISFGSGGGSKKFFDYDYYKAGDGSIGNAEVSNIEYIGETVNASFSMDSGDLAPILNNGGTATSITSSGFTTTGLSASGNGGTLNNAQMEYNTVASSTGATTYTKGSYGNMTITGLDAAETYYFRTRVSNNTYGWSAWSSWKTVTTLSGIPGTPVSTWSVGNIGQATADILGESASNNGSALNNWQTEHNTSASSTGSTVLTSGTGASAPNMTTLIPGTLQYARIRASNAHGYGPWSAWKSFTTLPGVSVNVGGVWKNATLWVNVGGVWKSSVRYVNVGGVWKQ